MKVKDKDFIEYISSAELDAIIQRMADKVQKDYQGKTPLFLVMLNGAFVFASDFLRKWNCSVEVSFVRYTSYEGTSSSGNVVSSLSIPKSVEGRDVIILEDIVDTGTTMQKFLAELKSMSPKSVALCSLFTKSEVLQGKVHIDYLGKDIPNKFIVGFGLDYDGCGRNLSSIYVLNE